MLNTMQHYKNYAIERDRLYKVLSELALRYKATSHDLLWLA